MFYFIDITLLNFYEHINFEVQFLNLKFVENLKFNGFFVEFTKFKNDSAVYYLALIAALSCTGVNKFLNTGSPGIGSSDRASRRLLFPLLVDSVPKSSFIWIFCGAMPNSLKSFSSIKSVDFSDLILTFS